MAYKTNIVSYDVLENKRDVSAAFNKIILPATPMLNAIKVGEAVSNTKYFWWDDVHIPHNTTLGAAYDQSGDSGVLTVASSAGLRVGSVIRVAGQVKRVSVVTNATTITTVHIGGASDADIPSGTTVEFVAFAGLEAMTAQDSDYTQKVERYNVTQIITDFVKMSGSQLAVQREIAGELFADEVARKMERLRLGLGRGIWTNPRVAPSDNNTARVFGGIKYFVEANGYNPTATTFSTTNLDSFLLELELTYGFIPTELWMNPVELAHFAALDSSYLKVDRVDRGRGVYVTQYISKYGHVVELKTDANAPTNQIYAIDVNKITLRPLAGRALTVGDLARQGDYRQSMLIGEYTLEINASGQMGVFNLSA